MRPTTITAIGTFTALTPDTALDSGYLNIDPRLCSGYGDPPVRSTEEAAPGEDGALIFPPFDDVWDITLGGTLVTPDVGTSIDTLYAALKTALDALKTAPDGLVHSAGTLQVWKNGPLDPTWDGLTLMAVTFGLRVDVFA